MINLSNEIKQVKQMRTKYANKIKFLKAYVLELEIAKDSFDSQLEMLNEKAQEIKGGNK